MDTVYEAHMVASMAALGGIAIIHSNCSASQQASIIRAAKSLRVPLAPSVGFVASNNDGFSFGVADEKYVFVSESGNLPSKLLGYVAKSDLEDLEGKEVKIFDYLRDCKTMEYVPWNSDLGKIEAALEDNKADFVVLERDGEAVNVVTKDDVVRFKGYPKLGVGSVGSNGEWMVGAAIGTRDEDKERLEHLIKDGGR